MMHVKSSSPHSMSSQAAGHETGPPIMAAMRSAHEVIAPMFGWSEGLGNRETKLRQTEDTQ